MSFGDYVGLGRGDSSGSLADTAAQRCFQIDLFRLSSRVIGAGFERLGSANSRLGFLADVGLAHGQRSGAGRGVCERLVGLCLHPFDDGIRDL